MRPHHAAILALLLGGAAASASAQKLEPHLVRVLDCAGTTDSAARLACYDAAIAPLRAAQASGALEVRPTEPKAREAKVRSVRQQGYEKMLVTLDTGDRFVVSTRSNEDPPRIGETVTTRRGVLGTWWFAVKGGATFRADFIGPAGPRDRS